MNLSSNPSSACALFVPHALLSPALRADFGFLSMVAALEHGLLHCIRFAHAKQSYLIYETDTGRSGVIGCLLLLPIVLPMKFEVLRTKVREMEERVNHV